MITIPTLTAEEEDDSGKIEKLGSGLDNKKVGGQPCHCTIGWVTADYGRVLKASQKRQAQRDQFKLSPEIATWIASQHQSEDKESNTAEDEKGEANGSEQKYRNPPIFVGRDDDLASWAIDGVNQMRWHGLGDTWGREWKENDIIGVALDLDAERPYIMYSLNGDFSAPMGRAFTLPVAEAGASGVIGAGLLPALSLTLGSSVRINFGTGDFVFQPPSADYLGVAMATDTALRQSSNIGIGDAAASMQAAAAKNAGAVMQIAQDTSVRLHHMLIDSCVGLVLALVQTLPEKIEKLFVPVEALAELALTWDTRSKAERIAKMIDALRQVVAPFIGQNSKTDHSDLVEASVMAADGEFSQVVKLLLAKAVKIIEFRVPKLLNAVSDGQAQAVKVDSLVEGLAVAVANGDNSRVSLVLGQFAVEVALVASPNMGLDSHKARHLATQLGYLFENKYMIMEYANTIKVSFLRRLIVRVIECPLK
jgi:hypothetical protein